MDLAAASFERGGSGPGEVEIEGLSRLRLEALEGLGADTDEEREEARLRRRGDGERIQRVGFAVVQVLAEEDQICLGGLAAPGLSLWGDEIVEIVLYNGRFVNALPR